MSNTPDSGAQTGLFSQPSQSPYQPPSGNVSWTNNGTTATTQGGSTASPVGGVAGPLKPGPGPQLGFPMDDTVEGTQGQSSSLQDLLNQLSGQLSPFIDSFKNQPPQAPRPELEIPNYGAPAPLVQPGLNPGWMNQVVAGNMPGPAVTKLNPQPVTMPTPQTVQLPVQQPIQSRIQQPVQQPIQQTTKPNPFAKSIIPTRAAPKGFSPKPTFTAAPKPTVSNPFNRRKY